MAEGDEVEIGMLRMTVPYAGGTMQAMVGFLAGASGEARASLTGRMLDGQGRLRAVGDIHGDIVQAFASRFPAAADFALAHGRDSLGRVSDGEPGDEGRAAAWERARSAWDGLALRHGPLPAPGRRA